MENLIHPRVFAARHGVPPRAITTAVRRGEIPTVDGRLDPTVAQEAWDRVKDLVSHVIVVPLLGVEYLELRHVADGARMTVPAHIRTRCGFPPRISNRHGKTASTAEVRHAFQRLVADVPLIGTELRDLTTRLAATHRQISLQQFIRVVLGYEPRLPLYPPDTYERDVEMEHAWEKLERLGLNPRDYLPEY